MKTGATITLSLSPEAFTEFKTYHLRATNTLEPSKWPDWLRQLDAKLGAPDKEGAVQFVSITGNGDSVSVTDRDMTTWSRRGSWMHAGDYLGGGY